MTGVLSLRAEAIASTIPSLRWRNEASRRSPSAWSNSLKTSITSKASRIGVSYFPGVKKETQYAVDSRSRAVLERASARPTGPSACATGAQRGLPHKALEPGLDGGAHDRLLRSLVGELSASSP